MTAAPRRAAAAALALAVMPAAAAVAETAAAETCAARLERTLAEMEARPLMKEELATGLMWLRLDARTALEAGDAETCLARIRSVEQILGLEPPAG